MEKLIEISREQYHDLCKNQQVFEGTRIVGYLKDGESIILDKEITNINSKKEDKKYIIFTISKNQIKRIMSLIHSIEIKQSNLIKSDGVCFQCGIPIGIYVEKLNDNICPGCAMGMDFDFRNTKIEELLK
jgi:hypothetical protein